MFFSQKDPAYNKKRLPKSWLTIGGYGCFLTSLCNLAGAKVKPDSLLKSKYFTWGGLLYSAKVAEALGMKSTGRSKVPPRGWCIGVTNKYAPRVPTHFLCVNHNEGIQIDPLDYPAKIEPISYKFYEYRTFTGVKLNSKTEEKSLNKNTVEKLIKKSKSFAIAAAAKNKKNKSVKKELDLAKRHLEAAIDKLN